MAVTFSSGSSSTDVGSVLGVLSSVVERLNCTMETVNKMDAKLDTKFGGLERRMDQLIGFHQVRLDKHDVELASQRQLLEDLRTEITLLRGGSTDGPPRSASPFDSPSVGWSASSNDWQPQHVLVRGWAPFGSCPSAKIDRVECKKLLEDLLQLLPDCFRNQDVVRASFAANYHLVLGVKGGGWNHCKEIRDVLGLIVQQNGMRIRGHDLRVSVELSPRKKVMLSNMFRAESFLKQRGVSAEIYSLYPKSCKILNKVTNEDLGETPSGSHVWM